MEWAEEITVVRGLLSGLERGVTVATMIDELVGVLEASDVV